MTIDLPELNDFSYNFIYASAITVYGLSPFTILIYF